MGRVRWGKKRWRIVGVYKHGDIKKELENLRSWMEEKKYERTLIGGNFNARTGRKGKYWDTE